VTAPVAHHGSGCAAPPPPAATSGRQPRSCNEVASHEPIRNTISVVAQPPAAIV